jgi:hypothetical protein
MDHQKQANDFLALTHTEFAVKYARTAKYFDDAKYPTDIYQIMLTRGERKFISEFSQSINRSGKFWRYGNYEHGIGHKKPFGAGEWDKNKNFAEPDAYCVLACLTKHDPGTFEDFCGDFGYSTDSRRAEKTYFAVVNEYTRLCTLYNGAEMEILAEIF